MSVAARSTSRRPRRTYARKVALALLALAAAAWIVNVTLFEFHPGNAWGLSYGTGAALLLLLAVAYGLRRRSPRLVSRLGLGRARTWLDLHLYGGTLFAVLVLMHSGFRLPVGAVTGWLWALSLWTVASGFVGLALQQWIPRALGSGLSVEVLYERIPEIVDELRQKAEAVVADADSKVQSFYRRSVAPAMAAPRRRWIFFVDLTGGKRTQLRDFDYLRQFLGEEDRVALERLAAFYRTKVQVDAHYTLQLALRTWLWAHAPLSLALVILLALHVGAVLYY